MSLLQVLYGLLALSSASAPAPPGPHLTLRASASVVVTGTPVVFTAQLTGGQESEELYCLTRRWDWGDETNSVEEGECPTYKAGETLVERSFSTQRIFDPGSRTVFLTLSKNGKDVVKAKVSFKISPPLGQSLGVVHGGQKVDPPDHE
jgi:hypothetical protein